MDVKPGDGICKDHEGNCTLRAAVMETNALEGAGIITLPAGTYILSIDGIGEDLSRTGDLDIADELTIIGAGDDTTIVDGGAHDRVFHVLRGSTVEISGVTVQNGDISDEGTNTIIGGGGIKNNGTLTLNDSTVTRSTGTHGDGGIANTGMLTLTDSTVSGNKANIGGGIISLVDNSVFAPEAPAPAAAPFPGAPASAAPTPVPIPSVW